jgi:hydrogenase/urease accessory protein HupE
MRLLRPMCLLRTLRLLRVLPWLLSSCTLGSVVCAHEVRPAYLEIVQPAAHRYDITWKQPAMGDVALHLVPHLSNGWLERAPDQQYAASGFLIRQWRIDSTELDPLAGRTIEIEGLDYTLTDVFVRARLANGVALDTIIRPESPRLVLSGADHEHFTLLAYMRLGIEHILSGPDHLLFVLGLVLIVRKRTLLLKTVSAFTLAHSITLAATILGKVNLPPPLVEAVISLSILFLAPEILRARAGADSLTIRCPWAVAFAFGLFHGMGFASGLKALGFQSGDLLAPLGLFNLGVEVGQLAFIAVVLAIGRILRATPVCAYAPALRVPAYVVGIAGAYWTLQSGAVWWGR